jgi:hypothetical protein
MNKQLLDRGKAPHTVRGTDARALGPMWRDVGDKMSLLIFFLETLHIRP